MEASLTITGDLTLLGKLAVRIDEWFPTAFSTEIAVPAYGGWTVERMSSLVRRLNEKQIELLAFVSENDGYRTDEEVRARFANGEGSMQGLTGPITRHKYAMVKEGLIDDSAIDLVKTERNPRNRNLAGGFRMAQELVPVVKAALRAN
jgi:hypothetical protein